MLLELPGDETPEIRIGRDGVWYYRNMEMTRSDIVRHFYRHLCRDSQGNYRIEVGQEQCRVQVDDVPYIIRSVSHLVGEEGSVACVILSLSDGCDEALDPNTIRVGDGNVLYCRVKEKEHEARFSRQAYYQLVEYIQYDEILDRYYMTIRDHSYSLAVNQPLKEEAPYAG